VGFEPTPVKKRNFRLLGGFRQRCLNRSP